MAFIFSSRGSILLGLCILLVILPAPAAAFGAGNIPSISNVEGVNWRHGDIEDMLKTIAFLKGHKWSTMMIKRVYFGNWLRDYSQAIDVGSLKGVSAPTIRILVWVLSFLNFGYATAEFEVTDAKLGVYRPEEHIDNPKGYPEDAKKFDPRLRGPVLPAELAIDPNTGMKNYIANESGGWATSTGYLKHSLARSIHFGRVYIHGAKGTSGAEADLCEALRCLGQALHCNYSAHSNYCELALRELGFLDVFPHTGLATKITLRGKQVFPIVTGTFGAVDFLHSVLGEASDHVTQTEVEELDLALKNASEQSGSGGQRGLQNFIGLVGQIPGIGGGFADQARTLQAQSAAQQNQNDRMRVSPAQNAVAGFQGISIPGTSPDLDPVKIAAQIYPILEFRDCIVKAINATIAKIPGLEALIVKISETLTLFILSLLAPFVRPIIKAVSESLKMGSTGVINASQDQQYGPWTDQNCTDPTHSMLSKDHFSNLLNEPAGRVAATVLQYIVPRVLYAWDHPGVPVEEVTNDIIRIFHHPAIRDENIEIQRNMFNTVRKWVEENPERGNLNNLLSSSSVKAGYNHRLSAAKDTGHSHNAFQGLGKDRSRQGSAWTAILSRDLGEMDGNDGESVMSYLSPSPRAGSPISRLKTQDYGYTSSQFRPQQHFGSQSLQPEGQPPMTYSSYQAPYPATYQHGAPSRNWEQGGAQGGPSYPSQPPYGGPAYGSSYGGLPSQYS